MPQWRRVSGSFLDSRPVFRSPYSNQFSFKVRRVSIGIEQCRRNHHGLVAGTVLSRGNATSRSADLINAIEPLKNGSMSRKDGIFLTILVSAQHARLALDERMPSAVLAQLFGEDQDLTRIESITAVIDQLPGTSIGNSNSGLTFLVQRTQSSDVLNGSTLLRGSAQRAGSLTFAFDVQDKHEMYGWELQLPLTQTVFSTGMTSTLIHRVQDVGKESTSETQLENARLRIVGAKPVSSLHSHVPLIPLTTSRKVSNAMGNIIRTVSSLEDSIEQPASQGLEQAVNSYFKALQTPPAPVNVWALIVPKAHLTAQDTTQTWKSLLSLDEHVLNQMWTSDEKAQQATREYGQTLFELIPKGGRLVKVLSGGGGWGKKAGLLSIDPDSEYSTRELRDDQGWNFDFEDTGSDDMSSSVTDQLDQALGSCVEEGDGIMFLIDKEEHDLEHSSNVTGQDRTSITLGARKPQETDEQITIDGDDALDSKHIQYIPGHFGMFSETGLAVKVFGSSRLLSKSKLEVPGLQVTALV